MSCRTVTIRYTQSQVDNTGCSFLIHQRCNLIVEQICLALFAFIEAMLAVTSHLFVFHVL